MRQKRHILDVNPEQSRLAEPFAALYKKARQHFCYQLSREVNADLPKLLLERDDIYLSEAVDRLINSVGHTVVPSGDMIEEYIEADGRLIEPHPDHEWRAGRKPEGPLECAYMNLFFWVYQGLHDFWKTRLKGDMTVIVNVTREEISLKGVLPEDVAQTFYGSEEPVQSALDAQSLDAQYSAPSHDLSKQRSASDDHAASDPPF